MEATIQSTNRAINIDILWLRVHGAWFMVLCLAKRQSQAKGAWSLPRLYRKELRLARAVARAIDAHPTVSNIALWLMGIGIMVEIFMFV